jgi:hypothetical protein
LPTWSSLWRSAFNTPVAGHSLGEIWCRSGDEAFWFSRSAWSMAIVAYWRQRIAKRIGVTVWIPDFFCNASLVPLRRMGARLVFYSVTNRLQPDYEACAVLARQQPPDVFVLVHYFGQPRPAKDAAAFFVGSRELGLLRTPPMF